jgi:hypothetical protein
MLRSATQIESQTNMFVEKFVTARYTMADFRQRGVSYKDNFNVNDILLESLEQNAIFDTLNTQQINAIIDTLI